MNDRKPKKKVSVFKTVGNQFRSKLKIERININTGVKPWNEGIVHNIPMVTDKNI